MPPDIDFKVGEAYRAHIGYYVAKIHIVSIIDEGFGYGSHIVYRYFGKRKQWWHYGIEYASTLSIYIHQAKEIEGRVKNMNEDFRNISRLYGVDPDAESTGKPLKRVTFDPQKYESPLERFQAMQKQGTTEEMMKGSTWEFHFSNTHGSDAETLAKIETAWKANLPFGLKCERSSVVFIPHKLKAYWIWSDDTHGPIFLYKDKADMLISIKFQYLGHKEFITTKELAILSKIFLYTKAINNVESWQRKILPESGKPSGSLEAGE